VDHFNNQLNYLILLAKILKRSGGLQPPPQDEVKHLISPDPCLIVYIRLNLGSL
jgi:hypothetical protein